MSISLAITSVGPIQSYDGLLLDIAKWLDREGDSVVTTMVPTFVQFAEEMFNRELRCPEMEATDTFTITAEDTPLPSDFLAMRAIYIEASPDLPLKGVSPNALKREFDGTTGTPTAYCLVSGGIRVAPPPASATVLTMDYFQMIQALSVANPSNWLLQKHPSAYLSGALAFAYDYLDDDAKAQKYFQAVAGIIGRINKTTRNNRFGAGPLVPNTVPQVGIARA